MNPGRHTLVRCAGDYANSLGNTVASSKGEAMHRLRAVIPEARIAPYDQACAGTDVDGIELYRWGSSVALAMFDDVGVVEVAMRSAMARELAVTYGLEWYRRTDLLDDDAVRHVADAWRMAHLGNVEGTVDGVHSRLVAALMFGFWVKLLGRGSYSGHGAARQRRIYDTAIWKGAIRNAFPNVDDLGRAQVEGAARTIHSFRNRIAHHEHIIWGVPMAGARGLGGGPARRSVAEAHSTLLSLAGYIDADLEGWLRQYSRVGARLARCPLPDTSPLLL